MIIEFIVPGKPFGKQRPKFSKIGGFVKTYTPKETVNYENLVKYAWIEAGSKRLADGPVQITVTATFEVPDSWAKKKKADALAGLVCPMRPDWDNVGKVVTDALNGLAYKDDAQINRATVFKCYGPVAGVKVVLQDGD